MRLRFSLGHSKGGGVGSDRWRIYLRLISPGSVGGEKIRAYDHRVWLYASGQRRHDQEGEPNGQQRERIRGNPGDHHISTHNGQYTENYRNQPKRLTRGIQFPSPSPSPSHISFSLFEVP